MGLENRCKRNKTPERNPALGGEQGPFKYEGKFKHKTPLSKDAYNFAASNFVIRNRCMSPRATLEANLLTKIPPEEPKTKPRKNTESKLGRRQSME